MPQLLLPGESFLPNKVVGCAAWVTAHPTWTVGAERQPRAIELRLLAATALVALMALVALVTLMALVALATVAAAARAGTTAGGDAVFQPLHLEHARTHHASPEK